MPLLAIAVMVPFVVKVRGNMHLPGSRRIVLLGRGAAAAALAASVPAASACCAAAPT